MKTMHIKLFSGAVVKDQSNASMSSTEDGQYLDKKCLMVYAGDFESMDGPVTISSSHINKMAKNYNERLGSAKLAGGEIDMKKCAPIQLDHSTSATHTVGRLIGPLSVGEHEGKKALFGTLRILGAENIEKVNDGRWTHLSIGADLENCNVSELTITPFPAAANAVMLKGTNGGTMKDKLKKYLMEQKKMSEKDADEHLSKMNDEDMKKMSAEDDENKKKLSEGGKEVDRTNMSKEETEKAEKEKKEVEAKKKMSEGGKEVDRTNMSADEKEKKEAEMKKLAAEEEDSERKKKEEDEAKKKLADGGKEVDRTKMSAEVKASLIKLSKNIKVTSGKVQLEAKKSGIISRLAQLRKDGKLSPGELKGINVDDIAGLDAKSAEVLFSTLTSLSKKIDTSMKGDVSSESIQEVHQGYKNLSAKRLEIETRMNMPSKRAAATKELAELAKEEEKYTRLAGSNAKTSTESEDGDKHFSDNFEKMSKLMDEGKKDDFKKALKAYMSQRAKADMSSDGEGHDEKRMSSIANDLQVLHNEYKELVSLVGKTFGMSSEELE